MAYIFDNLSTKMKENLLASIKADILKFKPGSNVSSLIRGDNIIGIIIEGYLEIVRTDHNGNRTIVEQLYDGDIFGTMISSLNNKEYDIIVKEETNIYLINYNRIINCDNNKAYYNIFIKNLLEIMMNKINLKNERLEILSKKSIRNKLLEYFNIASKKTGSRNIYLPFNYTDLADYLAVDRCAMQRELKYLKEEGLISTKAKRITLLYEQTY